jgi:HEPN domain-containing protein
MSQDKEKYQALRWLDTAVEDVEAAETLLAQGKYSHACFFAQQCGEKALKALWYALDQDPWGHSVQKLISELPDQMAKARMEELLEDGSILDRYYIPTRYPNGLPDLTPGKCYFPKDAELCITTARRILDRAKECLDLL